jgi:hypothetical protein
LHEAGEGSPVAPEKEKCEGGDGPGMGGVGMKWRKALRSKKTKMNQL